MKNRVESDELTPEKIMESGQTIRKLWLANLTPEELATLPLEKRLAGLAPEERLAGLDSMEMAKLMERIEEYLSQHSDE